MKPTSLSLISISFASLIAASAFASPLVRGTAAKSLGSLSASEASVQIGLTKSEAVEDAEAKCGSKVKRRSDYTVATSSGQYGDYFKINVSADFECIAGTANQLEISTALGAVRHLVFFRYKPSVTRLQRDEMAQKFLALRNLARKDGQPYVVSIDTGIANSLEKADQGMSDGFLVTFRSVADRDYYVGQPYATAPYPAKFDPAHDAFKKALGKSGYLDDSAPNPVFVFDFVAQ
jgi:hypothetical protein